MNVADQMEIRLGLPERYHIQAAEILYQAFARKLTPLVGSRERGVAILEMILQPKLIIAALRQDRLVGVAGLHVGGRSFVRARLPAFVDVFGWPGGLLRFALFPLIAQRGREDEVLVAALAVHSSMRGKGIGTRLLCAVFDYARANGYSKVALEVVDTNPDARRLYERMGFVATETHHYPYLQHIMGFSASTRMSKRLGQAGDDKPENWHQ